MAGACLVAARYVPFLAYVMSLIGSFLTISVSVIFPAACHLSIFRVRRTILQALPSRESSSLHRPPQSARSVGARSGKLCSLYGADLAHVADALRAYVWATLMPVSLCEFELVPITHVRLPMECGPMAHLPALQKEVKHICAALQLMGMRMFPTVLLMLMQKCSLIPRAQQVLACLSQPDVSYLVANRHCKILIVRAVWEQGKLSRGRVLWNCAVVAIGVVCALSGTAASLRALLQSTAGG